MDFNPLIALVAQVLLSTLVMGLTNATSIFRLAALPLMATLTGLIIRNSMAYMIRAPWAALVGGYSISFCLQYLDVGLLSKYTFQDSRNKTTKKASPSPAITIKSPLQRLKWALSLLLNFRFINTPRQIKSLPKTPTFTSTRAKFLLTSLLTFLISYLTLDLLTSSPAPESTTAYLSHENIPFFTRLSAITYQEIGMRIAATICLGISMNCVQGGIYSMFGFLSVLFKLSQPGDWPPFYGSPFEAWSLRRFWGVYWHQINTRKLISISKFVLTDVLGLDQAKPLTRYLRVVLIFFLSGVMHLLIDIASGISLEESGAMKFFMVQVIGVLIEDIVLKIYRGMFGTEGICSVFEKRVVGYLWVLCFLCWSVPAYLYPILGKAAGPEHSTIPWSVVGKVRDLVG